MKTMSNKELADEVKTSLFFLAWDVDEYVEPDFGDDEEQQQTFETMYNEMFDNLHEMLTRFKKLTNYKETD